MRKKLALHRETLRRLSAPNLRAVVGGSNTQGSCQVACTASAYCTGYCDTGGGTGACETEWCHQDTKPSNCYDCEM